MNVCKLIAQNISGYYYCLLKHFKDTMDNESMLILSGLIDVGFYVRRREMSIDCIFEAYHHAENLVLSLSDSYPRSHALTLLIQPSFPKSTPWDDVPDQNTLVGLIMQICCLVMRNDNRNADARDIYDAVISQKASIIKVSKKVVNGKKFGSFYKLAMNSVGRYVSDPDNSQVFLELAKTDKVHISKHEND